MNWKSYEQTVKTIYEALGRTRGLTVQGHGASCRLSPEATGLCPKPASRVEPPDELTPELVIDDKPLKDIIAGLYYPDSPYEFSVMPCGVPA